MHRTRGGLFGASGRAVVVVVAAVVALLVGWITPAAAADTTPPTLVSFSRTSAATVSPGQQVTLSYTANDDIDQAIASLRTMNAQNRGTSQPPVRLKLRVLAGDSAPDWAKNLDGPGTAVSVQDTQNSLQYNTVGRFWEPAFGAAYQDFMT